MHNILHCNGSMPVILLPYDHQKVSPLPKRCCSAGANSCAASGHVNPHHAAHHTASRISATSCISQIRCVSADLLPP